ncbi:MAG: zinc dependent phospholipase C family protein [Bacteroidota bacterium]
MQKRIPFFIALIVALVLPQASGGTVSPLIWGFFGHRLINRLAVYTLPAPLFRFYKAHLSYMEEHAADPDKRRYAVVGEAECHFIDLDQYGDHPDSIRKMLPLRWKDAVEKWSEPALRQHGIGPWNTYRVFLKLQKAFEERDTDRILRCSSELGHYIGDMHVPLHTTRNYNGQLTGQNGIHGLWESRLPELFAESYKLYPAKAVLVNDPQTAVWNIVFESHALLNKVFSAEDSLSKLFPDSKYGFENRGAVVQKVYSTGFSKKYQQAMDNMIEQRMIQAVNFLGNMIYTAWVNAGQPDLSTGVSRKVRVTDSDTLVSPQKALKLRDHE